MTRVSPVITLLLIGFCYLGWLLVLFNTDAFGALWFIPLAVLATFHSSLQHEAVHGHPTRWGILNEGMVFLSLGLWFPFRRYRQMHLTHHTDERLTDPYDDPETWYYTATQCHCMSRWHRRVLEINATLAGRIIIGPMISLALFYTSELRRLKTGEQGVRLAWLLHAVSVALVLWCVQLAGIHWGAYVLCVAYPSLSLLLIRSFIEHRAADSVGARTAVIEAGWFMSLLFLNNNLHAVHHRYPGLPWYQLPERWRQDRHDVLAHNEGNHFAGGYLEVARRWLFRRREPVLHPYTDRDQ